MAGHSQFKNIMHRKAAQDKKKAKVYTKLIRDIMTAARSGGGDLNGNPALRASVDKARKENMNKDVIDRAIKRGTGEIAGADYIERTYEGYGPSGVAVMVVTLTDNPTRTITNVRTAFTKNGGNVGTDGAVAWMFKHHGRVVYPLAKGTEERMMELALDAGADNVEQEDDVWVFTCAVSDFAVVRDALAGVLGEAAEASLTYMPTNMQAVGDLDVAQQVMKMIDVLEADDDVQEVVTNLELSDELAAKLA